MACFKDFSQPINCSLWKNPNKTNHREFKHVPWKANGLPWGDQAVVLDDYCRSLPTECFSSLALLQYQKLAGFNILLSFLLLLIKLLLYFFSCTIPFFSSYMTAKYLSCSMNEQVHSWQSTSLDNGLYIFTAITMMTTVPEEDYNTMYLLCIYCI